MLIQKESQPISIVLAGSFVGGALGLALSYLFRPVSSPHMPTVIQWFTTWSVSKNFGPIIVICGTVGAVLGCVISWFAIPQDVRKEHLGEIRLLFRLILLILIIGLTGIVLIETGLFDFFRDKKRVLAFLNSFGPLAFLGFIILQAAQVVAAPVPGEVTGLLGGFLYGPLLGVVLSTIGLTIGSYIAFTLARFLGRPFVERFLDKKTMSRFDYLLHHKGAFLVFLLFLIPGFPKDSLCYILGLGHLTTTEFLVIGGTGRLFGTILLTLGGTYIRHQQYKQFFILAGVAILVVLIAMAYRDKIERIFRRWQIMRYRREKGRRRKREHLSADSAPAGRESDRKR